MSVKIKGMNIPDSCLVCPLCLLNQYGNERYCFATGRITDTYLESYTRADECPMEEVDDNE